MMSFIKKTLNDLSRYSKMALVSKRDIQLLNTVKKELLPQDYESIENYVPHRNLGDIGFQLRPESQLEFLKTLQQPKFQALFADIRNNKEINAGFMGNNYMSRGLIHNGFYPTPDAELYAAMILANKPDTIIEIGSGYSTVIARTAVQHAGLKSKIHIIDPQPRRDIDKFADQIEYKPVEVSSLAGYKFPENSLLFIDSSHVCRSEGDLPFLYCKILPGLPKNVLIQIHDIFLPYDYPDNYFMRFYTEEYLLHALLAHSMKFEVVFATHFMTRDYTETMQTVFGPEIGKDSLFFGASFWIRTKA